jgi:hypothetical protein
MIKVEWSAAGVSLGELVLHFSFIPEVGVQFANIPANRKQAPVEEEISHTLLAALEGNTKEENN